MAVIGGKLNSYIIVLIIKVNQLSYSLLGNENSLNISYFGNNGDIHFKLPHNAQSPTLAIKTRDDVHINTHTHTVLHITRKLTYVHCLLRPL